MAFCTNCGAKLADDAKFCTECGAKLNPAVEPILNRGFQCPRATRLRQTRPVSDYAHALRRRTYTYTPTRRNTASSGSYSPEMIPIPGPAAAQLAAAAAARPYSSSVHAKNVLPCVSAHRHWCCGACVPADRRLRKPQRRCVQRGLRQDRSAHRRSRVIMGRLGFALSSSPTENAAPRSATRQRPPL